MTTTAHYSSLAYNATRQTAAFSHSFVAKNTSSVNAEPQKNTTWVSTHTHTHTPHDNTCCVCVWRLNVDSLRCKQTNISDTLNRAVLMNLVAWSTEKLRVCSSSLNYSIIFGKHLAHLPTSQTNDQTPPTSQDVTHLWDSLGPVCCSAFWLSKVFYLLCKKRKSQDFFSVVSGS